MPTACDGPPTQLRRVGRPNALVAQTDGRVALLRQRSHARIVSGAQGMSGGRSSAGNASADEHHDRDALSRKPRPWSIRCSTVLQQRLVHTERQQPGAPPQKRLGLGKLRSGFDFERAPRRTHDGSDRRPSVAHRVSKMSARSAPERDGGCQTGCGLLPVCWTPS